MRRPVLTLLLVAGALGGFASGFRSLHHRSDWNGPGCSWHQAYDQRLDAECARRAAEKAPAAPAAAPSPAPPATVE